LFWDDPDVLTVSIHESGDTLFPGTGSIWERGGPGAVGSKVNLPMVAGTGDASWLAALETVLPDLVEAFAPTLLVSQHGCDSHLLDPLAHLRLTTHAYAAAAALLDGIAHDRCAGRWLATGGGGYDVYRVVPRAWAIVWLTQAHHALPESLPVAWRERWADVAARWHQAPLPETLLDPAEFVLAEPPGLAAENARTVEAAMAGLGAPGR
ncbi:MAG: acetoin utilization protein AcuC, partial [Candidatus Limnocylindrales bacterium]